MDFDTVKKIVEAVLLAADRPLSLNDLSDVFTDPPKGKSIEEQPSQKSTAETDSEIPAQKSTSETDSKIPSRNMLKEVLSTLGKECESRGIELKEVASGFRYQIRAEYAEYIQRLWLERPMRYSRALLETLAIIAYRQPVTRGEIEEIRGVSVASSTIKTLREREWIRVLGSRDVPGRPAIYGTTREFLDYFNLQTLEELPPLGEIKDLDSFGRSARFVEPFDRKECEEENSPSPESDATRGE